MWVGDADSTGDVLIDRRRQSVHPRVSWASVRPVSARAESASRPGAGWRENAAGYVGISLFLDALSALVGLATAMALSSGPGLTPASGAVVCGVFIVAVACMGGYDPRLAGDGPQEFQSVVRAAMAAMGVIALVLVGLNVPVPRAVVFSIPIVALCSVVGRWGHRQVLHRRRAKGHLMIRTLLAGPSTAVQRLAADLRGAPYHGFRVAGVCLPSVAGPRPEGDLEVLGAYADIPQVAVDHGFETVIIAGSDLSHEALRRLSWALDRAGVHLVVDPGLVEVLGPRVRLRPAAGLSLLDVETGPSRRRLLAKAIFDRLLGSLMLLAAAPVLLVAAVAVAATSEGGAFYRQSRVGIDGREFTIFKLRSMYSDADRRREELRAASDGNGLLFKLRRDPRVTPVGRVLRRLSIDELPQLLNVVRGDMSLVGPRPPLREEVDAYPDALHRRLRVRPGLTGLWQVSGRSDLSREESVQLDLRYVDNWSLTMDIMILWKTARAVFGGAGAY